MRLFGSTGGHDQIKTVTKVSVSLTLGKRLIKCCWSTKESRTAPKRSTRSDRVVESIPTLVRLDLAKAKMTKVKEKEKEKEKAKSLKERVKVSVSNFETPENAVEKIANSPMIHHKEAVTRRPPPPRRKLKKRQPIRQQQPRKRKKKKSRLEPLKVKAKARERSFANTSKIRNSMANALLGNRHALIATIRESSTRRQDSISGKARARAKAKVKAAEEAERAQERTLKEMRRTTGVSLLVWVP